MLPSRGSLEYKKAVAAFAKKIADEVDARMLAEILADAGKKLDAEPIPTEGRMIWDSERNQLIRQG